MVWIGEFAGNGWLEPVKTFTDNRKLADPKLNLKGFFPILLESFGTWGDQVYGLPFDNYWAVYYNKCTLQQAGFDKPPATWDELLNVYAPKLTDAANRKFAFALQSRRGETQSADSFMRVLWPFGGSLLDDKFKSNLNSTGSQAGLKFRQDLMKYMPPGIVDYDHAEAVNALAQGNMAMITEWSAFFRRCPILPSRGSRTVWRSRRNRWSGWLKPALGGFSLGVNAQSSDAKRRRRGCSSSG